MTLPYDECRLILVPEDSVIPETLTLVILNGRKGFVGILFILRQNQKEEIGECLEAAMICSDPKRNTSGEGSFPTMIDAEERRCRQEIGLDTQIPYTVNYEWH